jgi:hypothetical protein
MLLPQKPLKTSQAEVLQPRMFARSAEAGKIRATQNTGAADLIFNFLT